MKIKWLLSKILSSTLVLVFVILSIMLIFSEKRVEAPQITCGSIVCMDFDGSQFVSEPDFLILLSKYGRSMLQNENCLDIGNKDLHVDLLDLLAFDAARETTTCDIIDRIGGTPVAPAAGYGESRLSGLIVSGKSNLSSEFQTDNLYKCGEGCTLSEVAPAGGISSWSNGQLTLNVNKEIFQLHALNGLVRLKDHATVVGSGVFTVGDKIVQIGRIPDGDTFTGTSLLDAAFHPSDPNIVYVVPVFVSSVGNPSHIYRAAAKVLLNGNTYSVERIYGIDPANDPLVSETYTVQKLKEIEVSRDGTKVFVTSSCGANNNEWLLIYNENNAEEQRLRLTDLDIGMKAPIGLTASSVSDELYVSTSIGISQVFRINIAGIPHYNGVMYPAMDHVTSMTEHNGTLYILGFKSPVIPEDLTKGSDLYNLYFSADSPVFTSTWISIFSGNWDASPIPATQLNDVAFPISVMFAEPQTRVVGRRIFYNNSAFDGWNGAIDVMDDAAIDVSKQPLMQGTATFANYTGFVQGITGLMYDIQSPNRVPQISDFVFRDIGKAGANPGTVISPTGFLVRLQAGENQSDRVVITFTGVVNTWLQVEIGTGFGLIGEIHWWGNVAGDSGANSGANLTVNATDEIGARNNVATPANPATVDNPFDYNKDKRVNATEQIYVRTHGTTPATCVKIISR